MAFGLNGFFLAAGCWLRTSSFWGVRCLRLEAKDLVQGGGRDRDAIDWSRLYLNERDCR